jgi:hypothetical protein
MYTLEWLDRSPVTTQQLNNNGARFSFQLTTNQSTVYAMVRSTIRSESRDDFDRMHYSWTLIAIGTPINMHACSRSSSSSFEFGLDPLLPVYHAHGGCVCTYVRFHIHVYPMDVLFAELNVLQFILELTDHWPRTYDVRTRIVERRVLDRSAYATELIESFNLNREFICLPASCFLHAYAERTTCQRKSWRKHASHGADIKKSRMNLPHRTW